MSDASFPQPTVPVTDYSRVWWVIDPRDRYGCCPDCQRLAAASPYTAPGSGGNELQQAPGDGGTPCGGACTCAQAYVPPHLLYWQPLAALTPDERKYRLYPKDQIVRLILEEDGLESLPDQLPEPAPGPAAQAIMPPYSSPHLQPPSSYPPTYPPHPTQPTPPYAPPYPPQQPRPYARYASPPPYAAQVPALAPMQPPAPPMQQQPPQIVYYQNQSFTGKAVAAFLLYWLGYFPGLIFNIMFINEAGHVKDETGRTPDGYGCLWATLIGALFPFLLLAGCAILGLAGGLFAGGAPTH